MYQIKRSFEIDAGHRVPLHTSKCKNLHGHRYKIDVYISWPDLDTMGFVMDFGEMKDVFGGWLNDYWDHGMILQRTDPWAIIIELRQEAFDQKLYLMDDPPTAECMARHLHDTFKGLVTQRFGGEKASFLKLDLVVYETPNCSARWPS